MSRWAGRSGGSRPRVLGAVVALLLVGAMTHATSAGAQDVGTDLVPQAHVVDVEPIVGPDGELWVRLTFEQPWGKTPPFDLFSLWFGVGVATNETESWSGWEWHDGVATPFESTATRGESGAYVLEDGSVMLATGITPDGPVAVRVMMASWVDETSTDRQADILDLEFSPEDFESGDPLESFGEPCFNLITQETIGQAPPLPEPNPTEEPTSTSEPAAQPTEVPPLVSVGDGDDVGGGIPPWFWAFGLFVIFLLWMAYVYYSMPRLAGTDPCRPEREAVARAKARLEAAQRDLEAKRAARTAAGDAYTQALRKPSSDGRAHREAERVRDEAEIAVINAEAEAIGATNNLAEAEAALAECEGQNSGATSGTPDPGSDGGSTPTDPTGTETAEEPACCPSGNWIGVNVYSGVMALYGRESGYIYLVCLDDSSRTAQLFWQGSRRGLGLGAEISGGLFMVTGGPKHPKDLEAAVEGVLKGIDGDFSLGASWSKLIKAGVKGGRSGKELLKAFNQIRDISKQLRKAQKAGNEAEAARHAAKLGALVEDGTAVRIAEELTEATAKGASSSGQSGGSGVNIPLGVGVQVGVWELYWAEAKLQSWSGCEKCGSY
jgi:hypothetical protein